MQTGNGKPREESGQVDAFDIGLDRAPINQKGQIQLPELQLEPTREDAHKQVEHDSTRSSPHHLRSSIKERKHEAAVKLRKTFHISKGSDEATTEAPVVLAHTVDENSGSRLADKLPGPEKNTLKELTHNPVDTVKSKVSGQGNHQLAANIAAKEVPHGQEVDLLNAQTAVERARTDEERLLAIQDLSKLIKERQSTFVRWTLDRHVTKLRVLPRESFEKKSRVAFESKSPQGDTWMDWKAYGQHLLIFYAQQYGGQYIGYGSDPPAPSKETILPNVERLLVASAPFQEFGMTVRRVYRWEKPVETTKYLLIYLTLWYFNLLLPGVLSAILYFVVERHVHGKDIEDLREDIKHTEDVHRTAHTLTEFIEKRGDEKWADELLEGVGPWLMIQLADLANLFETVRNFYEWRVPSRTKVVLGVFAVGIIITAVTPLWLLIKCMTFGAGVAFFGLFPIATNFPEYRLILSPVKYLLWNIPTHAEWAIKYIQAEGTRYEDRVPRAEVDPASKPSLDHGFYTAHDDGTKGQLVISTSNIRFVAGLGHNVHWVLPYDQIGKLEKQDRIVAKSVAKKIPSPRTDSGKDLRIVSKAGIEWVLKDMDKRDEAFSQMVGFSRTTWQVVW